MFILFVCFFVCLFVCLVCIWAGGSRCTALCVAKLMDDIWAYNSVLFLDGKYEFCLFCLIYVLRHGSEEDDAVVVDIT